MAEMKSVTDLLTELAKVIASQKNMRDYIVIKSDLINDFKTAEKSAKEQPK